MIAGLTFALCTLCLAALHAPLCRAQENSVQNLPSFPYAGGWLGADDAYSIPLGAHKSLWLFGDTFVGNPDTAERSKATTMIHNSIGISTCVADGPCPIDYYWRDPLSARPRAFFDTGRDDLWYWPLDGVRQGNAVYLSLLMVRPRAGAGPDDPFGFEIAGTTWARVSNLAAPPAQWHIATLPLTDGNLWAGVSFVRDGKFLLLYSQVNQGGRNGYMIVLRVPVGKIDDLAAHWEYYGSDRKWRPLPPHPDPQHMDPLHVIDQAISEMTVRYHAAAREWVAISPGPESFSRRIVARVAHSPVGPWSPPAAIFQFPEMNPQNPLYDKDTFCYATKEHIEFGDSKLVLTYACNSSLAKTLKNMQIYRPRGVVVNLPK
jgi:hypothetical protein